MRNVQVSLVGQQPGGALAGLRAPPPPDVIVLLHSEDPKSSAAAREVRQVAAQILSPGACELVSVDPFDMNDVMTHVLDVGRRFPDTRLTVNITGGTNIMSGAALVACFMLGADAIYIQADVSEKKDRPLEDRLLRLPVPRVVLNDISDPQRKVLRELLAAPRGSPDVGATLLAKRLKIDPRLASYHVRKLEKSGLVVQVGDEADGRKRPVRLTDSGRLFATMLS